MSSDSKKFVSPMEIRDLLEHNSPWHFSRFNFPIEKFCHRKTFLIKGKWKEKKWSDFGSDG